MKSVEMIPITPKLTHLECVILDISHQVLAIVGRDLLKNLLEPQNEKLCILVISFILFSL